MDTSFGISINYSAPVIISVSITISTGHVSDNTCCIGVISIILHRFGNEGFRLDVLHD